MKYIIRVDYDEVIINYVTKIDLDNFWMGSKKDAVKFESAIEAIKTSNTLSKCWPQCKLTVEVADVIEADSEYYADMYADEILPDAKSANSCHMQATFWLYAKNGYKQGYIDAINNNDL